MDVSVKVFEKLTYIFSQLLLMGLWVLPIIQGFVQIERCVINHMESMSTFYNGDERDGSSEDEEDEEDFRMVNSQEKFRTGENLKEDEFDLVVISRRSRHRAGMSC